MSHNGARRTSFQYVPETCNKVDVIFNDLIETLKQYVEADNFDQMSRAVDAAAEELKQKITIPFREGFVDYIAENERGL